MHWGDDAAISIHNDQTEEITDVYMHAGLWVKKYEIRVNDKETYSISDRETSLIFNKDRDFCVTSLMNTLL